MVALHELMITKMRNNRTFRVLWVVPIFVGHKGKTKIVSFWNNRL